MIRSKEISFADWRAQGNGGLLPKHVICLDSCSCTYLDFMIIQLSNNVNCKIIFVNIYTFDMSNLFTFTNMRARVTSKKYITLQTKWNPV